MDIQQSMEGFGPLRELCETAVFETFREGVEQAPHTAILKDRVSWFPPFLEHGGDEPVAFSVMLDVGKLTIRVGLLCAG
jgi:hypothetical protein